MIASANNDIYKQIMKLKQKKHRFEQNRFLVEGEHLVQEAIACGRCLTIVAGAPIADWNGQTIILSEPLLHNLSELEAPAKVFAVCEITTNQQASGRLLLLDGIQDPGNLGTLIRSAKAFGFATVVCENCVDYYNAKVIRSTQGAIFKLSLINADLETFINNHSEYWYYGTAVSQGVSLENIASIKPLVAVILGNEARGVRPSLLDRANEILTIRMADTESLNVGVAGSIIMHHLSLVSKR